MFPESKITEIYCMADDFCKEFAKTQEKYMVKDKNHKHRNKPNRMSDAEIMVILILFHSGGFRCFKHYYKEYVCKHLTHLFPRRVSYNRFVELEKEVLLQLTIDHFHQGSPVGHLYRYQLCGFHPAACMPEPTHIDTQDF